MPLDDEIIEKNPLESEESTSDNSTDYPADTDDPEVEDDDSLVQDEESGSTAPEGEQSEPEEEEPDSDPENIPDEIVPDETIPDETVPEEESILPADDSLSDNSMEIQKNEISSYSETVEVYTDLEAFEASTIQVDLYQYTILNRLEFIQYALCIVIALLFLQLFVRYKK